MFSQKTMTVPPQSKVTWGKVENGGPYVIMHLSYFPPDGEIGSSQSGCKWPLETYVGFYKSVMQN